MGRQHATPILVALVLGLHLQLVAGCSRGAVWGNPDEEFDLSSGRTTSSRPAAGAGAPATPGIPRPGAQPDARPGAGPGAEDPILFGVDSATDSLTVIDRESGAVEIVGAINPSSAIFTTPVAMTVRSRDNTLWVWNNSSESPAPDRGSLLRVDFCTGLGVPVDPRTPDQGEIHGLAYLAERRRGPLGTFTVDRLFAAGRGTGGGQTRLFEVDIDSGVLSPVGPVSRSLAEITFDANGALWGLELGEGGDDGGEEPEVVTIDLETGEATVVFTLEVKSHFAGGLVFESPNQLLAAVESVDRGPLLLEIDPGSGAIRHTLELTDGRLPQGLAFSPGCSR